MKIIRFSCIIAAQMRARTSPACGSSVEWGRGQQSGHAAADCSGSPCHSILSEDLVSGGFPELLGCLSLGRRYAVCTTGGSEFIVRLKRLCWVIGLHSDSREHFVGLSQCELNMMYWPERSLTIYRGGSISYSDSNGAPDNITVGTHNTRI